VRADLWNAAAWPESRTVPSPGRMLAALTDTIDGEAYDAALPQRVRSTLY
jgi:hypothetical protein